MPHLFADAPLRLSIVAECSQERIGATSSTTAPFYVIVTNQSDRPVRVWREWCSWGYFALSLEAKTPDGRAFQIKKKPTAWTKNFPDYFIILPNAHFVLPVKLNEKWQNYPTEERKLSLRAHYQILADKESKEKQVWTGKIISPWMEVTLYK